MRVLVRLVTLLAVGIVILLSMAFSMRNTELVAVDFMVAQFSLPVSLWLILALLLGAAAGLLASSGLFLRLKLKQRQLDRLRRQTTDNA